MNKKYRAPVAILAIIIVLLLIFGSRMFFILYPVEKAEEAFEAAADTNRSVKVLFVP